MHVLHAATSMQATVPYSNPAPPDWPPTVVEAINVAPPHARLDAHKSSIPGIASSNNTNQVLSSMHPQLKKTGPGG